MVSQTVSSHIAEIKGIPAKDELEQNLRNDIFVVTFKKLDGDERKMTCTKRTDLIPKDKLPKTETKTHDKTVTVWDTNALDWRSFRYDRIISVEKLRDV